MTKPASQLELLEQEIARTDAAFAAVNRAARQQRLRSYVQMITLVAVAIGLLVLFWRELLTLSLAFAALTGGLVALRLLLPAKRDQNEQSWRSEPTREQISRLRQILERNRKR